MLREFLAFLLVLVLAVGFVAYNLSGSHPKLLSPPVKPVTEQEA